MPYFASFQLSLTKQSLHQQLGNYKIMQLQIGCQVCFTSTALSSHHQQIIRCSKCKQSAHRFCYLPECQGNQFICDTCKHNFKGICYICENPGLLKKVQKQYAHPICLLFSPNHLLDKVRDLSFFSIEGLAQGKRLKCQICKKVTSGVIKCGLECKRASHLFCALKAISSSQQNQSKNWKVCMHICATPTNYMDLIQLKVHKVLTTKNHYFKKKLTASKTAKAIAPSRIFCTDHSDTLIECVCNVVNFEKIDWIYCEGCCRWLHSKCVESQTENMSLINSQQPYVCRQCLKWNKVVQDRSFQLMEEFPKLHLYDFVYIQFYFEQKKYELSSILVHFSLTLPIFPGSSFIESEYRKQIAKKLRSRINLPQLKKQLQKIVDNTPESLEKTGKLIIKQRNRFQLIWILTQSILLQPLKIKIPNFIQMVQQQRFQRQDIKQIFSMLSHFQRDILDQSDANLRKIQHKIQQPDDTKSVNNNQIKLKQQDGYPINRSLFRSPQEIISQICVILQRIKIDARSNQTVFDYCDQIIDLINLAELEPYYREIAKVKALEVPFRFRKNKKQAHYILLVNNQIQFLKQQWSTFKEKAKNMDDLTRSLEKIRHLRAANRFVQLRITNQKDHIFRMQILRNWTRQEIEDKVPSKLSNLKDYYIIPCLTYENLSHHRVYAYLTIYNEIYPRFSEQISQISILLNNLEKMQKILKKIENLSFTQKNRDKMQSFITLDWSGQIVDLFPIIIETFVKIYNCTYSFLDSTCSNVMNKKNCIIEEWNKNGIAMNSENGSRFLTFLKEISHLKLSFFKKSLVSTIKDNFILFLSKQQKISPVFTSLQELQTAFYWYRRFEISLTNLETIKTIFQKQQQFRAQHETITLNFDNIQIIQKYQTFLRQYYPFYLQLGLNFRTNYIKTLLLLIDLHKISIKIVPLNLILTDEQLLKYQIIPNNKKPDFCYLRDVYKAMIDLQFPNCYFIQQLGKIIKNGQILYQAMMNIFKLSNWGYDLSQHIEWEEKIAISEFLSVEQQMNASIFYYEAELIEFSIIKEKFKSVERSAQLLQIQYEKSPSSLYLQQKAKKILADLGAFPIKSTYSMVLWSIYESPKTLGLPQNLNGYLQDLKKGHKIYCSQQIKAIKQKILKLQNRYLKGNAIQNIDRLLQPNNTFKDNWMELLIKWSKKQLLTLSQIDKIKIFIEQYEELKFADSQCQQIIENYAIYNIIMEWNWSINLLSSQHIERRASISKLIHKSLETSQFILHRENLIQQITKTLYQRQGQKSESLKRVPQFKKNTINSAKGSDFSSNQSDFGSLKGESRLSKEIKLQQTPIFLKKKRQ